MARRGIKTAQKICRKPITSAPVIFTATAKWKNGKTDIEVRRLANGKFRVIDVCREGVTPQGTGVSRILNSKEAAVELALFYKSFYEARQ